MKKNAIKLLATIACITCLTGCNQEVKSGAKNCMTIDETLIVKPTNYSVRKVEGTKYPTIAKYDSAGHIVDDFKILTFTDTHLDLNIEKGNATYKYMLKAISKEQPDLVVFVGDNITSAYNKKRSHQLCQTLEKYGIYYTMVLGNHEGDNIGSISRKKMLEIFGSYEHCLVDSSTKHTNDGTKVWGHGNYVINVLGSDNKINRSLYFVDGGADMSKKDLKKYNLEDSYDYIKESQITWYSETVQDINSINGSLVKSIIFEHIALPEFKTAYDSLALDSQNTPIYNVPNQNGTTIYAGLRREKECCPDYNSGMFDKIKELGSTQAFISGHDHINDYALNYQGVYLIYARKSGYSSYNTYSKHLLDYLIEGYTEFDLYGKEEFSFKYYTNSQLYPNEQADILSLYD